MGVERGELVAASGAIVMPKGKTNVQGSAGLPSSGRVFEAEGNDPRNAVPPVWIVIIYLHYPSSVAPARTAG